MACLHFAKLMLEMTFEKLIGLELSIISNSWFCKLSHNHLKLLDDVAFVIFSKKPLLL